jgi:hypothetical protein
MRALYALKHSKSFFFEPKGALAITRAIEKEIIKKAPPFLNLFET